MVNFSVSGDPGDVDGASKLIVPPRSRVKMTIEIEIDSVSDADQPGSDASLRHFSVSGRVRKLSVQSVTGPGGLDARHEQLNGELVELVRTMGSMG